jgi:hypothetical protein
MRILVKKPLGPCPRERPRKWQVSIKLMVGSWGHKHFYDRVVCQQCSVYGLRMLLGPIHSRQSYNRHKKTILH